MYEYKFVKVSIKQLFPSRKAVDASTEEIRKIIIDHAKEGWRFVQVYTPIGQRMITGNNYEVIFEKEA